MNTPSSSSPPAAVTNISDERKRKADHGTLTDDVNNNGKPAVCCPCVKCQCGCHNVQTMMMMQLADVEMDAAYLDSLPIGYRFDPTDKELIVHYLLKKINNEKLPRNKISEANIYGNHPKDIVEAGNHPKAIEGGWYFFTSRNRKYVHGKRPSRKAGAGYWKATGPDKVIKDNGAKIGGKKSLVYYEGHPPNGRKTCWMMHEYVVEGYERKRIDLKDMKLDDYVLCKIYTKAEHGKEDQVDADQQPPLASNDLDENVQVNNEQALVPYPQARLIPNQDANPTTFHVENNVVVQHFQNFNHVIPHVDNNLQFLDSNHHMNTNIVEIENRVKEVNGESMVLDQQANHQDLKNATTRHVENNLPIHNFHQHINPSVENEVKEVKRLEMVPDHQARVGSNQNVINPAICQVENNMMVRTSAHYYDRNVGTMYGFMTPNPVQMTSFRRVSAPLMNHPSPLTRFNQSYSLPNPPYFPPTPRRSPPLPPRIVNAPHGLHGPHGHVHPPMYWTGPKAIPPRPQEAFQEISECDGLGFFEGIELMINQDGHDGLLDDNFQFRFDEHEQLGADESQKHQVPRVEDAKNN